jgi:tetratricopeptide (TPR) repeat protein
VRSHRGSPGDLEGLVRQYPGEAKHHIGMANACAMQFEATRTDPAPDAEALRLAERHARHACGLDPELAEAWATLGFVLERTGRRADALAALERAVTLEPDNWRHQVRLALGSRGETRLRAARAALKRCPQLPLAHWLAASVFVTRHALDQPSRMWTSASPRRRWDPPRRRRNRPWRCTG